MHINWPSSPRFRIKIILNFLHDNEVIKANLYAYKRILCISGKVSHTNVHVFVFMMMFFELFLLRKSSELPKRDLNPQPSDHRWDALTIQLRARFRNGQAGQLPRGPHNDQGASTYSISWEKKIVRKNVFVSAWVVFIHSLFYIEVSWLVWGVLDFECLYTIIILVFSRLLLWPLHC